MVKKTVLGRPFWKIWKAPNLHARPMRFRKCIACIVTNRSMRKYLNICIYLNFGTFFFFKWTKIRKIWTSFFFFNIKDNFLRIYFSYMHQGYISLQDALCFVVLRWKLSNSIKIQCAKKNCWVQADKYWVMRSQPTTTMRQESQICTELRYLVIPWLLCAYPQIV